jgi:hypothetical protein
MNSIYTGTTLALVALAFGGQASAAAPQVRTQAPGFYRMMLGRKNVSFRAPCPDSTGPLRRK